MVSLATPQVEPQTQKQKLASSYNALLDEFSAKELHTVGNYKIGKLIGKGAFGKVYLASHTLINRSKIVLKSAKKDDSNLAREIHHHRQFLHPHIARLYEVIVTESLVWLVLEYCPGDELYYYLTKNGPIEPEKVKKIFTQLVGAVSYVHQKSCVHRDLKLENILLDKNEDVKLCDFGFTREYEGKSSYLQTWCGTVCYSAPEMLKGEKYAGEKVDVWSLGVILYALLCGELPFDEDDDDATKMKILKEEPKYPDTLPSPAKDLLALLLSKRPLLRPSLAEILTNPWLADYAPTQQAILKLQQPPPFSTELETETLQRMRSAGVNIDSVIENVLSQRCDPLAGWWALLLEKEERKEKRRQRRRSDRDADVKAKRRISTASGRLLAATIQETDEERSQRGSAVDLSDRGRSPLRQDPVATPPVTDTFTDTQIHQSPQAMTGSLPRPEFRAHRPTSQSRTRRRSQISQLGPGIPTAKRNSMLQVVTTDPTTLQPDNAVKKRKRKYQPLLMAQLASIKSWFKDPGQKLKKSEPGSTQSLNAQYQKSGPATLHPNLNRVSTDVGPRASEVMKPGLVTRNTYPARPHVTTTARSSHSRNRMSSHSPSPITPRSSYRRSTGGSGLRGRKSTSSSVSSVRSFAPAHVPPGQSSYYPGHSKASSASSDRTGTDVGSPTSLSVAASNINKQQQSRRRSSPNIAASSSFVKVLPHPASPSPFATSFSQASQLSSAGKRVPPRINLPINTDDNSNPSNPFAGMGPPSPGLPVFARRKRTPFRGPNLLGPGRRRSDGVGLGVDQNSPAGSTTSGPSSAGRKSNDGQPALIEEEDEDEDGFEDVSPDYPASAEVGQSFPGMGEGSISGGGGGGSFPGVTEEDEEDGGDAATRLRDSVVFPGEFKHAAHAHAVLGPGSGVDENARPTVRLLGSDAPDHELPLTKWELQQ